MFNIGDDTQSHTFEELKLDEIIQFRRGQKLEPLAEPVQVKMRDNRN